MKIQILGSGCPTCKNLHKSVADIVKKLKLDQEVEYSDDIAKIVELGAMGSPVFVIDDEVITSGTTPSEKEIKEAICERMKEVDCDKSDSNGCCSCNNH